jgi:hypothetical protein
MGSKALMRRADLNGFIAPKMGPAAILVVLVLAGCVPAPSAPMLPKASAESVTPADAATCRRAGGVVRAVGRRQTLQCVIRYADVGKSCSSGSQCSGDCRTLPGVEAAPGQQVAGSCQPDSDRFGCSTKVENGRAQSTICID